MKILLVEDEKKVADFVQKGLEEQGFLVEAAYNGDDGFELASHNSYDAIVLDIMLPGRDGLSILKGIRDAKNGVPVVMLSARSGLEERIDGLNLGADDYLTKPFYVEELVARLQAVMRRRTGERLTILEVADLKVNLVTRDVVRATDDVRLTSREFSLLEYLMRSIGRIYTRTQILEHVWGYDFDTQTNIVDVHIQRLRKKINVGDRPDLIETIRGVGYRMRQDD